MDNAQGGHELLHLQTNRVVKRHTMTKISITPSIIKQVHALAVLDGMPEGLKITNRANNVIFDTAWIAGVDYDEQEFDDEDYDKEEENEDKDDDDDEDHYDKMDENELANILQQPNEHQEPHEPEDPEAPKNEEHEIVFEEAEEDENEELFEDHDDEAYAHEDEQVISLEVDDADGEEEANQGNRRTGRVRVPPQRYQHLQAQEVNTEEYTLESVQIIAMTMLHYNTALVMNDLQACSFLQTYSLKQGIKKFGSKGVTAARKELHQLHNRVVYELINLTKMKTLERKRAMKSLIFSNEKGDGETVKARICSNGSTQ
jgi:hypothetical protein